MLVFGKFRVDNSIFPMSEKQRKGFLFSDLKIRQLTGTLMYSIHNSYPGVLNMQKRVVTENWTKTIIPARDTGLNN